MRAHEAAATPAPEGVPAAPVPGPARAATRVEPHPTVDGRVVLLSGLAIGLGVVTALVAQLLGWLIAVVTNLAFYLRFSAEPVAPEGHHLGKLVVVVPVLGGLVVGLMARHGSRAIRGHGIPEAMEQVLTNESRIAPRMTFLKPLSSAIAIGTGGPFGAEGPIIATGGALGSLVGQVLPTTPAERKALLAAGAAAGMSATFGSPVSAVLLAIELLLFEYRPRSLVPVSLAAVTACGMRLVLVSTRPAFAIPDLVAPGGEALAAYLAIGALMGLVSVGVTRAVYAVEDGFERLPLHWMWWPAIGGIAVGLVGLVAPRTMGVGYTNIEEIVGGKLAVGAVVSLTAWKFVSWSIALGSGTSGGTLAPLFTIGGGLGALAGATLVHLWPDLGVDVRIAALVGMAALFAGSSRALLASVVFAFETTRQPFGLLPLLGACTTSFLVSSLLMRHSIMTEKIARRGVRVLSEYGVDFLEQLRVRDFASKEVIPVRASDDLAARRAWLASGTADSAHQGFPVLDDEGALVGVLTRRDLLGPTSEGPVRTLLRRAPLVVTPDASLRAAIEVMIAEGVGRLAVVAEDDRRRVIGMLTRSDVLAAHGHRMAQNVRATSALPARFRPRPRGIAR
jgi:H+/Cl- antiporter ClcA/CBS domain-containing protein